jgi:putative membrane protein
MSTLFAFLHHLAAFMLVSAIAVEFMLVRQELTLGSARHLLATDAVVGVAATLLLVVGLARVFYFEKGAAYYFASPAFLTKLSVFVVVAILSWCRLWNSCRGGRPSGPGRCRSQARRKSGSFALCFTSNWPALSSLCFAR